MGLALAGRLRAEGARVTIVGRSAERLASARHELAGVGTAVADIAQEEEVRHLFATVGPVDHVVTTAADLTGAYQPAATTDLAVARRVVDVKLLGPFLLAKYGAPVLAPGGSLTFTSGINAYRPGPRAAIVSAANGALASLAYALALDLAPVRVNVVSPGWVDSPIWDVVAGDGREATLDAMAKRLPVGRVGRPADIAEAYLSVMRNGFVTGTVLHVDGGQRLV